MRRRRGIAVITALVMILVLSTVTWAFLNFSETSLLSSFHQASNMRAFHGAEAGVRYFMVLGETDEWTREGRYEFSLETVDVVVTVEQLETGVTVTSVGTSGTSTRSIVLRVNNEGYVVARQET